MSIKSIAFPFRGFMERRNLGVHWWHRLLVVLFFVSVLSVAAFASFLVFIDTTEMRWSWRDEAVLKFRSELGDFWYAHTPGIDFIFVPTIGQNGKVALVPVVGLPSSSARSGNDQWQVESICEATPSEACTAAPFPTLVPSSGLQDALRAGGKVAQPILFAGTTATYVPVDALKDAINKGGRLVTKIWDDKGVARWIPNEQVHTALTAGGTENRDIKRQAEEDGIKSYVPLVGIVAFPRALATSDIDTVRNDLASIVAVSFYKHLGRDCALALLATIFAYYVLQLFYRIALYVALRT